jgi:hypothetical protein
MATVNRVERKPERNNKIYVRRVYPGINMPKSVNVNPQYVFQEKKIIISEKPIIETKEDIVLDIPPVKEEIEIIPKTKGGKQKKSETPDDIQLPE